ENVKKAFKVHFLFGLAVLVAFTIVETVKDIEKLTKSDNEDREDKSIEFLKMKLGALDFQKMTLTYKDHLRLMMLFNRENQYARAISAIEQVSGQQGIGAKPTQIKVINKVKIKPWFLPNAVKTFTSLDSKLINGKIELKSELYYSY
uniref:hypothetical protein n=1 Tax=Carnobacterium divergens TaxID=2748 RepID=UPI0039B09482